jgi:hypothetical protein
VQLLELDTSAPEPELLVADTGAGAGVATGATAGAEAAGAAAESDEITASSAPTATV